MAELVLSKGYVALVDDEDLAELAQFRWHSKVQRHTVYAARHPAPNSSEYLHRRLMGLAAGDPRKVDHINGNGLDNRRANLRVTTHAQNLQNRRGVNRNNQSGYLGVSWRKDRQRWAAFIQGAGRRRFLGNFTDPTDAARAYDRAALATYGEFATLNFQAQSK